MIVCSARSGSTKALGTTNLLLRAASEALQRNSSVSNSSGFTTPQTPLVSSASVAHNKGFWSRKSSISATPANGASAGSSSGVSRSRAESPSSAPRSASPSPFAAFAMSPLSSDHMHKSNGNGAALQPFHSTIDLLRADHITAARANVRNPDLLQELEAEIERDCEGLRSFLFAAQVS